MKKIIITSNILWTITQFRKELIEELKKEYKVFCIADIDNFSDNSFEIIKELGVDFLRVKIDRKGINPLNDIFYFIKLLKLYYKIKPDLVIHYTIKPNIYGSIASRMLNIKSFAVISGLGSSFIKNNFISKVIKFMYKYSLSNSKKVLFLNIDDMRYFLNEKLISKKQAFKLPGEGVNVFHYNNCKNEDNNKITFLMVARLLKDKGIYEYIDAIKNINNKNVKFLLAGVLDKDNPTSITKDELNNWIENNIIEYLGTTNDTREFYKKCDIVVLPSYREGLSRVLLEACSCEKFIITTNIAGCKELCDDNVNGFLAIPKSYISLQKAIEKTISLGKEEIITRGKYSRKIVEKSFSSDIVNEQFLKLIKEQI